MITTVTRAVFRAFYAYSSLLNRIFPEITRGGRRFVVLPGVYKSLEHEEQLANYCDAGQRVLEVGCGAGLISIHAAWRGAKVTAVDISLECVENTRINARAHNVELVCEQSDLFGAVHGSFDRIICAAPYIDLDMPNESQKWATSAGFVERFLAGAAGHLAPAGKIVLVSPASKQERIASLASAHGLRLASVEAMPRWTSRTWATKLVYLQPPIRAHVFILEKN